MVLLAQMIASMRVEAASQNDVANASTSQTSPNQPLFVPGYRQANRAAVLTIHGEIDMVTLWSLERRMEQARERGCDAVVIEIHTPGGRLDAARDIEHLIKHEGPVNTVAWINDEAFSAGTLIALACREIVVAPDATWGDCAPIAIGHLGELIALPEAERAKMEAPLRADVVDSARRHGYDENLVQAFIAVGIELWMLENIETGARVFVDRIEYRTLFGAEPPAQIVSATPPPSAPGFVARPVSPIFGPHPGYVNEFEGLTPEERERESRRQIEEAQNMQPSRAPLAATDAAKWRFLGQVDSSDKLLVVNAQESIAYGLAEQTVKNDTELAAYFGINLANNPDALVRLDQSWSEHLVRFLVSTPVRIVLIIIFVLALLLEMAVPSGLFGALAAVVLLIFIGAPFFVGMAQWWAALLIVAGLGLLAVEFFIVPGFGVAGVGGVAALLVGTVASFVSGDIATPEGQTDLYTGIIAVLIGLVGAGIGVAILSRHIHDIPFMRRLVLSATTDAASADTPGPGLLEAMATPALGQIGSAVRVGDLGVAATDLRPSGRAIFAGRAVDVVTAGGYIAAGENVRAVHVGQFRVEVEGT